MWCQELIWLSSSRGLIDMVKGIISTLASLATGKVQTRLSQIWAIRNRIKHLGCVMSWNHLSGVGWSSKRDGMAGVQISGFTASGQATVSKCDCRTTEVHSDFLWRHVPARPGFYSPPASPQIVVHVVNWEGWDKSSQIIAETGRVIFLAIYVRCIEKWLVTKLEAAWMIWRFVSRRMDFPFIHEFEIQYPPIQYLLMV